MQTELRKIITIDEELCNGCGLCVDACHEGAIALVDGKAKLMFENYCDGLGDCLPACPTNAITFEHREAAPYDEAAVLAAQQKAKSADHQHADHHASSEQAEEKLPCGCPGTLSKSLNVDGTIPQAENTSGTPCSCVQDEPQAAPSQLAQWPAQIKLVSPQAPYFNGADLLVAADCTAFAYGSFHKDFMAGKITIIGCPKLDAVDYSEKLAQIISQNDIKSVTVTRMEVPCCGGLEAAVKNAVQTSGKDLPVSVVTISIDGNVLS